MDYSKLSDQEVNAVVAKKIGIQFDEEGPCIFDSSNIDSPYSDGEPVRFSFDPCNNAADAWPIIESNGISIVKHGHGMWLASSDAYWVDGVEWQIGGENHPNPLRAAMIVFLMMQESANVPANTAGPDIR